LDKISLSKRDICTKFITPALRRAGWDEMLLDALLVKAVTPAADLTKAAAE
jgi:type I site-specific restriction endonuclease